MNTTRHSEMELKAKADVKAIEDKATEIRDAILAKLQAAGLEATVEHRLRIKVSLPLPAEARITGDSECVREWLTVRAEHSGGLYPQVRGVQISHDFYERRYTVTMKPETVDVEGLSGRMIEVAKAKLEREIGNNKAIIAARKNSDIAETEFPIEKSENMFKTSEQVFGSHGKPRLEFRRRRETDGTYEIAIDATKMSIDSAIALLQELRAKTVRPVDFKVGDMHLDLQSGLAVFEAVKTHFA